MNSGNVIYNRRLKAGDYHLALRLPTGFADPLPGQFVMLRTTAPAPLLSRPFSVYRFTRHRGHVVLELLYRVVGGGTKLFSQMPSGTEVKVLGPLGRGFRIGRAVRNHVLIAGGMGIAPISFLAEFLQQTMGREKGMTFCLGAKSSDDFVGLERLEEIGGHFHIATDDGTLGTCGLVTDMLPGLAAGWNPRVTSLYVCGPPGMLRSLAACLPAGIPCQVSMEARMACGLGACLGCAISTVTRRNKIVKKTVCRDGPVFDLREICWEAL